MRGAVSGSTAAGRIVVGRPCLRRLQWDAALCRRYVGSVRVVAHDLDVDDCPDFLSPPQRMSVMERARQVQGLAGRRVRRARPSEPRAGTVTPLSVRTLTGGDVGIGRDVRPSYVQVGAGARMYGFTTRGGRALPSIRTLDNMDTHVSLETTPRSGLSVSFAAVDFGRGSPPGIRLGRQGVTVVGPRQARPIRAVHEFGRHRLFLRPEWIHEREGSQDKHRRRKRCPIVP